MSTISVTAKTVSATNGTTHHAECGFPFARLRSVFARVREPEEMDAGISMVPLKNKKVCLKARNKAESAGRLHASFVFLSSQQAPFNHTEQNNDVNTPTRLSNPPSRPPAIFEYSLRPVPVRSPVPRPPLLSRVSVVNQRNRNKTHIDRRVAHGLDVLGQQAPVHDPLLPESPKESNVVSGMPRSHDLQRSLHLRSIQHLLALLREGTLRGNGRGGKRSFLMLCDTHLFVSHRRYDTS